MKLTKKLLAILLTSMMLIGIFPVAANAAGNTVFASGSSDYSILLPSGASEELQFAASELNLFLNEIAGVTLPIAYDTNGADTNGKWISIGNTSLFRASGNSVSGLKGEASCIKTYNSSILLYGGSEAGATFAVYDLLEHWFGLKFYTPDCYTYTASTSVSLETINQTKIPAVDYRFVSRYLTYYTPLQQVRRMRGSQLGDFMNTLGHSYFSLLSPYEYYSDHPDWYSNYDPATSTLQAGWQLCLSNSSMRAQLIANVKAKLAADRAAGLNYKYFAICQNDGEGFCTCWNCKLQNLKYSSSNSNYSGAQLALLNEVAAACKDEYPDVIFYMLAYTNYSDQAPTKNITAADNVGVMLAPIDCQSTNSYFGNSGTAAYNNGRVSNNINKWSAICDHLMMWGYAAQFGDYMCPTNTFDSLNANAQGYANNGFEVVFNQAHATVLPFFETMKNYLECKAFYDGSINTSAEITNFINNYYGAAGSAISDYYTAFINNQHAFENKGNDYASFAAGQYLDGPYYYSPVVKTENYSKSYVDTCKSYFDAAYAALANTYGVGTEAYNTYKKRVDLEYLGVLYIYLQLYRSSFTDAQGTVMTQQAIDIIAENNVSVISTATVNTWINAFHVVPEGIEFYDFEQTSASLPCTFAPYSGEVAGKSFSGVKMTASSYQPHFKLTASGVQNVKSYCAANGYDTVRIHAYADLYNNSFVMNGSYFGKAWGCVDIPVEDISESIDFWSQSEGASTVYLWFEYLEAPAITPNSFTGNVSFTEYSGTVAGETFDGFRGTSASYQPHFHFTQAAVDKIKAYADEVDATEMIIHAYANLYNNCLVLNNQQWVGAEWKTLAVPVSALATSFDFWSQSEGTTEIYLWFEFPTVVGGRSTVAGSGWNFENYSGTVGGETFEGIRGTSAEYQPHFTFTEDGIASLNAFAAENGFNTLVIHSYANLYNNCLVLDNQQWVGAEWKSLEIPLVNLSTSFDFWSQSEGLSEVYLWFDFTTSELISRTSFSGSGWDFQNYSGTVGNRTIEGIRGTSGTYQPDFYFTSDAVAAIKAYAAENNYETLRISTYAIQLDNGFVVNGNWTGLNSWNTTDVKISDLSTSFRFWSQSQGSSEVYLVFEFVAHEHTYTSAVTTAATCEAPGVTTYTCACGDTYTEPIAALGHDIVADAAVSATCTEAGLTAGEHCSRCDYAVAQETVPALGHDYIYTDNGATHTVTCSRCDYSKEEAHNFADGACVCGKTEQFKITSASLKLNEDINLIYAVSVPTGCTNVYMVFDYMGCSFKVTDYTVNDKGEYCFTFAKLVPQCMCENVSATAYATSNGTKISITVAEYSVKTYCENMLGKNPSAALKTLLSDLLTYGAATQTYLGYKTDSLATAGLTLTPGSYGTPEGMPIAFEGDKSTVADWKSAALGLSNALAIRFTFEAASTSDLTVEITINGRTKTFDADDFVALGNGFYTVTFRDIPATEFGETVTACFLKDGSPVGRTVSYSVNTYISTFENTSNTAFAQLLLALYNYGKSAAAYK